ncbi:probable transmembrane protein [marine gamma proteobacterium HTCC2143]|uniref:Probable transmembrane protein n=1 Tax=marine gamma proteobacterium HTCC2143 TaxID=247633 RepID=A0Y7M6_9GAMM|nr:probable transmembrane protein [marine gamma proteobacterium HTCC2143]
MSRLLFGIACILGAAAILWMSSIFVDANRLALGVTVVIGGVYCIGFIELLQFRRATSTLSNALSELDEPITSLDNWLAGIDATLKNSVRLRIESDRVGLPAPVLTPYLVGLLVMLGLLGTFVGMVDTLRGAVFALEGSTELQAIREGLAAPINGLSLAFGTSVAGVAASAMLGLSSTLSRRDRMMATRLLDGKIGTVLRVFSLDYNRQQTYSAMQAQAQALPEVAQQLQTVAASIAQMGENLSGKLIDNQNQFHQSVTTAYTALATSVDQSLTKSLADSGRQVGLSIKPIIAETMEELAKQAQQQQQQLSNSAQQQLASLTASFSHTSDEVTGAWKEGLAAHAQSNDSLVSGMDTSLNDFSQKFEEMAASMQQQFGRSSTAWLEQQEASDKRKLIQWEKSFDHLQSTATATLTETSSALATELRDVSTKQQADFSSVTENFGSMSEQLSSGWQQMSEHMTQLSVTMGRELNTLREVEHSRAKAAVDKLEGLEATFAAHIVNLGRELEEPMTRLIETASETPKAAAEVIAKLRVEMSNNLDRDNQILEERHQLMERLGTLSDTLEKTSMQQRDALEQLINTSTGMLGEASSQFSHHVDTEVAKLSGVVDHFSGNAIEMSSLGESFNLAVKLYSESNSELIEHLNRIELAMDASNSRSDEQMGYYVDQAREIIDQSLLSQREVFEQLRQLGGAKTDAVVELS